MLEYQVTTRTELIAALNAIAHREESDRIENPARIVFGTCTYTFREGLTPARARQIAARVREYRLPVAS